MAMAIKDWFEIASGDRLPIFRATSRHLSAIHPFFIEGGLVNKMTGNKIPGLPHGFYGRGRTGGIYFFDEVQMYQAGELGNINVAVVGDINYRKSSMIKFMIYNGVIVGYNHLIIDPKGEYGPLAAQLNLEFPGSAKIIKFGENSETFVNPLDRVMPLQTQRELLISLVATATGTESAKMDIRQKAVLWEAIKEAHNRRRVPTLPDLVNVLFDPGLDLAERMRRPEQEIK